MIVPADPYEVLAVDPDADGEHVRAAFRALAKQYHPDFNDGRAEQMVALNGAWAILGDPEKRAAYDQARTPVFDTPPVATVGHDAGAAMPVAHPRTRPTGPLSRRRQRCGAPSRVLDFGRYANWSLEDVEREDPAYLEWLERTPIGRPLRGEIQALFAARGRSVAPHR